MREQDRETDVERQREAERDREWPRSPEVLDT